MGNSGPAHEVGTFSSRADNLHIREILPVRDRSTTWSTSIHSVGKRLEVYDALFPKGYRHTANHEYSFPPIDGWSVRKDHTSVRGHAASMRPNHKGSWEEHLPLVEFAYNKSYQASIQMAPREALYGRPRRSPLCWTEVGESSIIGPDLIRDTFEKVSLIRQRLLTAQSRQKSYADVRRRPMEFEVGDRIFLKVMPKRGVVRFGKRGK